MCNWVKLSFTINVFVKICIHTEKNNNATHHPRRLIGRRNIAIHSYENCCIKKNSAAVAICSLDQYDRLASIHCPTNTWQCLSINMKKHFSATRCEASGDSRRWMNSYDKLPMLNDVNKCLSNVNVFLDVYKTFFFATTCLLA